MQPLVEGLKEEWKAAYEIDPRPYWDYTVVRKVREGGCSGWDV